MPLTIGHEAEVAALVLAATRLHRSGDHVDAERTYLRALAIDPGHRAALNNLGTLYTALGERDKALAVFRRFAARHGDDPVALLGLGRALVVDGHPAEARSVLERAASIAPAAADVHNALGIARNAGGDRDGAIAAFRRALEQRPDFIEALSNLVDACLEGNRFDEAIDATNRLLERFPGHAGATFKKGYALALMGAFGEARALTLDVLRIHPGHAPAHNNLGAIASWQNDHAAAIGHFEEALRHDRSFWDAELGLAHSLLALGDYARGWQHYEARPAGIHRKSDRRGLPGRLWQGEALPGKTLLVHGEAGLGDVLQFCRLVPIARQRVGRLVLYLQPYFTPLARILQSLDGVDAIATTADAVEDCEACVSVMSLPRLCGGDLARAPTPIPYLRVTAELDDAWRRAVAQGTNLRVGLAWSGSPRLGNVQANVIDRRRSLPLPMLAPLFEVPDVDWYSLQMGDAASDPAHAPFAARITDLTADIGDFADTGALIQQLDLVISVDTSVLHLACALAKPTWMPNRFDSCWRWGLDRSDAPWYPTLRIFRQRTFGDWAPVVADIAEALARAAAQHDGRAAAAASPQPAMT